MNASSPVLPSLPPPKNFTDEWEATTLAQIALKEPHPHFMKLYKDWNTSTTTERRAWLSCVSHYLVMDTDGDGVSDWTAIVDEKPSRVLYPNDSDIDGDGLENIFDPQPLQKNTASAPSLRLPEHLLLKTAQARVWQNKLYHEFGLLAVDHTATHSSQVLQELYTLLKKSFSPQFIRSLKNVRYLYAFTKHDGTYDIAAYHRQMQALSIGGDTVYSSILTESQRQKLLSTFAHELGHAFLLAKIHPQELKNICEKNGWKDVFKNEATDSFYSAAFFKKHPGWQSDEEAHKNHFFTLYSYSNAHEWFADAFARVALAPITGLVEVQSSAFAQWLTPYLK